MWNASMRKSGNINDSVQERCRFVKDVTIEFTGGVVGIVDQLSDRWQFYGWVLSPLLFSYLFNYYC